MRDGEDMDAVYRMGFDEWSGDSDMEGYLVDCRNSAKYSKGKWFIREAQGKLVSSMIVYEKGFGLPASTLGFASIATGSEFRGSGHAQGLILGVLREEICLAATAIYLHSDIGREFYEKLGFVAIRESRDGSHFMVKCAANRIAEMCRVTTDYF